MSVAVLSIILIVLLFAFLGAGLWVAALHVQFVSVRSFGCIVVHNISRSAWAPLLRWLSLLAPSYDGSSIRAVGDGSSAGICMRVGSWYLHCFA